MKILTRWRNFKNIKKELRLRPGNAAADKKPAKKAGEGGDEAGGAEQSRKQAEGGGE